MVAWLHGRIIIVLQNHGATSSSQEEISKMLFGLQWVCERQLCGQEICRSVCKVCSSPRLCQWGSVLSAGCAHVNGAASCAEVVSRSWESSFFPGEPNKCISREVWQYSACGCVNSHPLLLKSNYSFDSLPYSLLKAKRRAVYKT